jgi:hypothetical protein
VIVVSLFLLANAGSPFYNRQNWSSQGRACIKVDYVDAIYKHIAIRSYKIDESDSICFHMQIQDIHPQPIRDMFSITLIAFAWKVVIKTFSSIFYLLNEPLHNIL